MDTTRLLHYPAARLRRLARRLRGYRLAQARDAYYANQGWVRVI